MASLARHLSLVYSYENYRDFRVGPINKLRPSSASQPLLSRPHPNDLLQNLPGEQVLMHIRYSANCAARDEYLL